MIIVVCDINLILIVDGARFIITVGAGSLQIMSWLVSTYTHTKFDDFDNRKDGHTK
jgi:hypothetical protein